MGPKMKLTTQAGPTGWSTCPIYLPEAEFHCDCSQLGPVPGQEGQRHEHHGDADSVPGHFLFAMYLSGKGWGC